MSEIMYMLLGYFMVFVLVFVTVYGTARTILGGKPLLGLLILFAVFFTTIFRVHSNLSCGCIFGNDMFRAVTRWFMEDVLDYAGSIVGLWILMLAFSAFVRGERMIAPGIMINAAINLFLAGLWGLIFSSIVTFYVCPLICEHYIDWNIANENIWAALRQWLGTG